MRKSKSIIIKSCWLITFSIICIFFLEANSLSDFRRLLASQITFFQGKRALFSNILIGILGSAVLTLFCEIIEYQNLKKEQHAKIVYICRKWERTIQYSLPVIFEKEQDVELFLDRIVGYWDEISSIYTEYVPFFREGIYIKLIRSLYEFVYTVKEYFGEKEDTQNNITYFTKMQEFFVQNKCRLPTEVIDRVIEDCSKNIKMIEELNSGQDSNASIFLKEINHKKKDLDTVLIYANALYRCGTESNIRQEDLLNDIKKIQITGIKIQQEEYLRRFKKIMHMAKHPISTIRTRYLLYKYSKKSK